MNYTGKDFGGIRVVLFVFYNVETSKMELIKRHPGLVERTTHI
jgi:hypothetical protein